MKTILLLSLLLVSTAAHAQAVLRVNNTPGSAAPYTTIAAAVTAAGVNDIIMVEGSNDSYGDITINKKVTIIGPGYLLAENLNLQATPLSAMLGTITLNSGATGSSLSGLIIVGSPGINIVGASNIAITNSLFFVNCFQSAIVLNGTGTNLLIASNYLIANNLTCGTNLVNSLGNFTGVLYTNNYSRGLSFLSGSTSSFLVSNNIFEPNLVGSTSTFQNSVVQNNIFTATSNPFSSVTGSTFKNNIFVNAQLGLDPTNLISQPFASLFAGVPVNSDTYWRLKAGSPAIAAGVGGADCGIYGGTSPYRPSGIAVGQPTITDYVFPVTIPKNGVLNVKVSAKVN
jgi:hypothetical protein